MLPKRHDLNQNDRSKKNVKNLQNANTCQKKGSIKQTNKQKKKHSNASDGTEGSFTDKRYNLPRKHRNHRPLCA